MYLIVLVASTRTIHFLYPTTPFTSRLDLDFSSIILDSSIATLVCAWFILSYLILFFLPNLPF